MFKRMIEKLKNSFSDNKTSTPNEGDYFGYAQTFTYFIPAPPSRKLGYREKAFDGIVKEISKNGFDITDIKTQSIGHKSSSGMWVILILRPLSQRALDFDLSSVQQEMDALLASTADSAIKNHHNDDNLEENCIELPLNTNDEKDNGDAVEGIYYID